MTEQAKKFRAQFDGPGRIRLDRYVGEEVGREIADRTSRSPIGEVECQQCLIKKEVTEAFRCFYCLYWFCDDCAEVHFGKSREEFWKEKEKAEMEFTRILE